MMDNEVVYCDIKRTILSYLPDARILLFGSRARGAAGKNSDYDLMVITPGALSRDENLRLSTQLNRALVHAFHAPFDILLCSEEEILEKQVLPGHIVRTVMREGVAL